MKKFNAGKGFRSSMTLGLGMAVAAATVLAGCAASPGTGDATEPDRPAEIQKVTVSINPSSQFAPMFLGIESGIFADHGLELEIVPQTDVAAILSGVSSGQYDFGFATVVHVVNANLNNIPIRAVTSIEGQLSKDDKGTTLLAGPGTGIKTVADMEGKTMATVGLSSSNTLTTWGLADKAGIDPKSIELVQMPFGQMPAALASGDVDAAVMQWPFVGEALDNGSTVVAYNNQEFFAESAITLMNTSQQFIDENPEVVQAFSDAMIESQLAATADEKAAKAALVDGLGISAAEAENARWNVGGEPYLELKAFETVQDMLIKYAGVDSSKKMDVKDMVWPGALEY